MIQRLKKYYSELRMIRNAINTYPDGICFAEMGGRPILVNRTMGAVCFEMTGHTVINAEEMWQELQCYAIPKEEHSLDTEDALLCRMRKGTIWQFQRKMIHLNDITIVQYEASDITELYTYRNRLAENNLQVSKLHERQRELLKNIVQNNLDKELLSAKMRIHDDFGRLLIMTKNVLNDPKEIVEPKLFTAWENVIADMENATVDVDEKEVSPQKELVQVADLIGCQVEFQGKQPRERKALLLLYAAIREALTNAVKHAGADKLSIHLTETEKEYHAIIISNGKSIDEPIRERGGLTNLRRRLEQEGATLSYQYKDSLELVLTIPKEGI